MNVDAQPHVAENGVGHVEVKPAANTVHGESNMIHVEDGAVKAQANGTINVAEHAIDAKASTTAPLLTVSAPVTTAEGAVKIPVTFEPNAGHVELVIQPHAFDGMIVVHMEGAVDAATGPMKRIEQSLANAGAKGELYLMYAIGFLIGAVVLAICLYEWRIHHLRNQLANKGETR